MSSSEDELVSEQLLQERLQILLQRLGWSYAALWTFNPQTRVLEWKRGHLQKDTTAGTKVWYAQQLCTTYRSCSFVPGAGFVGRAYVEGQRIWLSGDLVCLNAGSLQQSQFLRDAHIKTVMCIPWLDSVLELGTTNLVGEEFELMDRIQQVMSHDLLSVLPDDDVDLSGFLGGHINQNSSPASTVLFNPGSDSGAMTSGALNRPSFQSAFDNLSDQVWRSDLFIQEQGNDNNVATAWMKGGSGNRLKNINMAEQSTSHGLMSSHEAEATQYDSFATTSSSNGSSQGDNNHTNYNNINISTSSSPARPASRSAAATTPDHLHQQYHLHSLSEPAPLSVPDRTSTSSSVRLAHRQAHQLQEPSELAYPIKPLMTSNLNAGGSRALVNHQNGLRRTTSCNDQYEIQKALSLFEAQSDQWQPGQLKTPAAASSHLQPHDQFPFPSWQHDVENVTNVTVSSQSDDQLMGGTDLNSSKQQQGSSKLIIPQQLLRRHTLSAMEVLKEVDTFHEDQAAAAAAASNVSYEFPQDFEFSDLPARVEINTPRLMRGRSRISTSHGSGVQVHSSHSDAAMNHMLAERRRRVKQKENFATLRRLVPIISKADKASTLVDAIAYLKDLQNTIVNMEAKEEDMDQRCESLAHKCMELEEQNKELVAILSRGKLDVQVDQLKRLQSMKSI